MVFFLLFPDPLVECIFRAIGPGVPPASLALARRKSVASTAIGQAKANTLDASLSSGGSSPIPLIVRRSAAKPV
ncbi:MAG: hypothetical protein LH618_14360 [Saprospiraceae bacterium]|nr:hypothetical protein [Saprospiraceae bacterium]